MGAPDSILVSGIGTLLPMDGTTDRVESAALIIKDGRVAWRGPASEIPRELEAGAARFDAGGGLVTPGLIECHTHLLHCGSRAAEYEARAGGITYEQIAREGGGIARTVEAVLGCDASSLAAMAVPRLLNMLSMGVTTIEIKTGYALNLPGELRMLQAIDALSRLTPVSVVSSFLGAHSFPKGTHDRASHVDSIVSEWIPEVARGGLARFCDVFCENVAFGVEDARRVLRAAADHGLLLKVHAEQLSASGAARLAADMKAVSAEHLDFAGDQDIEALAAAGVVAVLLPGCPISLCNHKWVDARRFLRAGVRVALSTDFNPGSSVTMNLPLMGTFAMSYMGMDAMQAWRSLTVDAAAALALPAGSGTLAVGAPADLVVFHCGDWRDPFYNYGMNQVAAVIKAGVPVVRRTAAGEVQYLVP